MAQYIVKFTTTDSRKDVLEKKLREHYPGETICVEKIDTNKSRSARLDDAEGDVNAAVSAVQELLDETQGWYDNMPANLQESERGERLNDCIGDLQEIVDTLEGIEWTVEFPGMMD